MSDSNQECKYDADKSQQKQNPGTFIFNQYGQDSVKCQDLTPTLQSNDRQQTTKEAETAQLSDDAPVEKSPHLTKKSLRKKDSTGVRWVDWEGIAEISQKKG